MSFAFLFLGKTNVAFFDATGANRVSQVTPIQGVLGSLEPITDPPDPAGPPAVFTADVSIQENHGMSSQITDHPVEDGSPITDHIRINPRTLRIRGTVTDTPSGIEALLIVPGLVDRFASVPRSIEAFQAVEKLWEDRALLDIVTGLKVYQNMAIESVQVPRSAQVGRSFQFTISMREIFTVSSQVGVSPDLDGATTTDNGSVVPQPL